MQSIDISLFLVEILSKTPKIAAVRNPVTKASDRFWITFQLKYEMNSVNMGNPSQNNMANILPLHSATLLVNSLEKV